MKGYNLLPVFSEDMSHVLMCVRKKEPYLGLKNFVGGRIEPDELGFDAAYRELYEETGITGNDIILHHLMDFTYCIDECVVEVWAGRLTSDFGVYGDENQLFWSRTDCDFFAPEYAGEGNIGHIMLHCMMNRKLLESV